MAANACSSEGTSKRHVRLARAVSRILLTGGIILTQKAVTDITNLTAKDLSGHSRDLGQVRLDELFILEIGREEEGGTWGK